MFLIGGHGDQKKKKDVWKLNLSCFKEPNYHWTRLSDLEVPTHRCFTFAVDSKENKVEKILKGSLDLIPSPPPSVKIQIIGGKVY